MDRNAPIIKVNPHAYAYLQKIAPDPDLLGGLGWGGIHVPSFWTDHVVNLLQTDSKGLQGNAKASVEALMKTIDANRARSGGVVFLREGLHPARETLAVAEERVHEFQRRYAVDKSWLDKYPELAKRAKDEMFRQKYPEDQHADEISAKILAGDSITLSPEEAKQLDDAYREAVEQRWGKAALDDLPDLDGNEERRELPPVVFKY